MCLTQLGQYKLCGTRSRHYEIPAAGCRLSELTVAAWTATRAARLLLSALPRRRAASDLKPEKPPRPAACAAMHRCQGVDESQTTETELLLAQAAKHNARGCPIDAQIGQNPMKAYSWTPTASCQELPKCNQLHSIPHSIAARHSSIQGVPCCSRAYFPFLTGCLMRVGRQVR